MSSSSRPSHRHSNSFPSNKLSHTTSRATHALESTETHHNNSSSMASSSTSTTSSTSRSNKTASRIMITFKRSLSYTNSPKKRETDFSNSGMYSTLEERNSYTPSRFGQQDPSTTRPTIEQIAMGLHRSRTPHLRSPSRYPSPGGAGTQSPHHRTTSPLPPPPARSALKKPSGALSSHHAPNRTSGLSASVSSTTVTSTTTPSTPQSGISLTSFKTRMSRFLPGSSRGSLSAPSSIVTTPLSSPAESSAELQTPRKAVRFFTPGSIGPEEPKVE